MLDISAMLGISVALGHRNSFPRIVLAILAIAALAWLPSFTTSEPQVILLDNTQSSLLPPPSVSDPSSSRFLKSSRASFNATKSQKNRANSTFAASLLNSTMKATGHHAHGSNSTQQHSRNETSTHKHHANQQSHLNSTQQLLLKPSKSMNTTQVFYKQNNNLFARLIKPPTKQNPTPVTPCGERNPDAMASFLSKQNPSANVNPPNQQNPNVMVKPPNQQNPNVMVKPPRDQDPNVNVKHPKRGVTTTKLFKKVSKRGAEEPVDSHSAYHYGHPDKNAVDSKHTCGCKGVNPKDTARRVENTPTVSVTSEVTPNPPLPPTDVNVLSEAGESLPPGLRYEKRQFDRNTRMYANRIDRNVGMYGNRIDRNARMYEKRGILPLLPGTRSTKSLPSDLRHKKRDGGPRRSTRSVPSSVKPQKRGAGDDANDADNVEDVDYADEESYPLEPTVFQAPPIAHGEHSRPSLPEYLTAPHKRDVGDEADDEADQYDYPSEVPEIMEGEQPGHHDKSEHAHSPHHGHTAAEARAQV